MRSSVRSRLAPPYFQSLASTPSSAARVLCRGLCRNLSFCSLNSPNPPAASRANRGRCASPGGLWGEPAQQRKQLIGGARLAEVAFHLSLIHISEPTRRTPISYAVFCLKKKK